MTDEKKPIDPTKPQQTRTSNTRWEDVRRTLMPGSRTSSSNNDPNNDPNNSNYSNNEEEVDEDRRSLLATGIVAGTIGLGVGAVGAGLYADRDDDIEGPGIIEDDDPETVTEEEPEPEEPIDRYMDTAEYETIPGPDAGEGYNVEEQLLREYNELAWEEMAVEDEYEELGTGSEFYLQEDGTVVGVNEREQLSRIFPPEEFPQNEDYSDLYEELEERD